MPVGVPILIFVLVLIGLSLVIMRWGIELHHMTALLLLFVGALMVLSLVAISIWSFFDNAGTVNILNNGTKLFKEVNQ